MSTKRYRWARRFISSSLLALACLAPAALAARKKPEPAPPPTSLEEAELAQAKDPGVYLLLRPSPGALEVRSKGLTLETIPLQQVAFLRYHRLVGSEKGHSAELPLAFVVAEDADGSHRKVIAPEELRPYPGDDQQEEVGTTIKVPPNQGEPLPEPPPNYRIALQGGWKLEVTQTPPRTNWSSRLRFALNDGWARLKGEQPDESDLVVLAAEPENAKRIHHLFRAGMQILIDTGSRS
ncbi:MAG TPA: hypothetical protein PK413_01345 [Thermoanaerobaculia bacterium]|nr:hypothetical protein [Thermoanaerobaculia bacterium]